MIVGQEKPSLSDIAHYGVKGMHWGVIRDSAKNKTQAVVAKIDKKKAKKVAIVAGSVLLTAAVVAGSIYVSKNLNGSVGAAKLAALPKNQSTAKDFATNLLKEPTDVIHATRGKNQGFQFRKNGGLSDPFVEWSKNDSGHGAGPSFLRYGDKGEKVIGTYLDPLGRKDRAGRVIPHSVILPKHLADNVHNADDLIRVSWPLIKDDFDKFYDS